VFPHCKDAGSGDATVATRGPLMEAFPVRPSELKLPDPLTMLDGTPARTPDDWFARRRPELQRLFERTMYGEAPPPPQRLVARTLCHVPDYLDGQATLREVDVRLGGDGAPTLRLLVVTPNAADGPVPCFVGPNFCGNHTLVHCDHVALPRGYVPNWCPGQAANRATDAGRGRRVGRFQIAYAVSRGYAVASFYHGDVDPDRPDFRDGVHAHYYRPGQTRPEAHQWGTIAAWAWGLSRAVDYLVTDPRIDPSRIAAVGHSRNGKTALLAGAFDERIALVVSHQSGCGGAAPSRGEVGESVRQINTAFPHWFNNVFKQFNDGPERLPFDQHCLVAMVAPRPCLLTNAEQDQWANPAGQFEVLRAADRVYRFLGVEGLEAASMPPLGRLVSSRLGYWIRPGRHSMGNQDWRVFLRYADRHFAVNRRRRRGG